MISIRPEVGMKLNSKVIYLQDSSGRGLQIDLLDARKIEMFNQGMLNIGKQALKLVSALCLPYGNRSGDLSKTWTTDNVPMQRRVYSGASPSPMMYGNGTYTFHLYNTQVRNRKKFPYRSSAPEHKNNRQPYYWSYAGMLDVLEHGFSKTMWPISRRDSNPKKRLFVIRGDKYWFPRWVAFKAPKIPLTRPIATTQEFIKEATRDFFSDLKESRWGKSSVTSHKRKSIRIIADAEKYTTKYAKSTGLTGRIEQAKPRSLRLMEMAKGHGTTAVAKAGTIGGRSVVMRRFSRDTSRYHSTETEAHRAEYRALRGGHGTYRQRKSRSTRGGSR